MGRKRKNLPSEYREKLRSIVLRIQSLQSRAAPDEVKEHLKSARDQLEKAIQIGTENADAED